MRVHVRLFLFGLLAVIGLTWVGEASAFFPSGGSRLLFYFTKKSFAAGAANDTAQTLLFVTNGNNTQASRVGIKYYRSDCVQEIGPIFQNIGAGQTLRIDVAAQAPTFQEGIAEAFFVNASNQPIRNDLGVGSSIIIDLGLTQVLRLPAALLHSDDRLASFDNPQTTIANNGAPTSFAPLLLSGNFADPGIVTTRIALFAPGTVSGSVSSNQLLDVDFRREDGGGAVSGPINILCGRSLTLAQVRGQTPAQFQSAFPDGGVVAPQRTDPEQKGIVGWLVEIIQLAPDINILFGQLMQSIGTVDETAHP